MPVIEFKGVNKSYGENDVLKDFSIKVEEGEFLVLLGPSGCGKTTILRMINGLLTQDSGEIFVKGKNIKQWNLIELRRGIGYVIQQIGLLPHLNIEENLSYVLNLVKTSKQKQREVANNLIELIGMDKTFLKRYPKELSGGQQQRIGVARALAADPQIILMDEPFGAVDEITRRNLQDEIIRIHSLLKKTIIFVTHDIEEAIKLGSRIVLLNEGKIERNEKKKEFVLSEGRSEYANHFFQSKDFMAYLNILKIGDVIKFQNLDFESTEDLSIISEDLSVLQGIQRCIEIGEDKLAVADEFDKIIGFFDLTEIYSNITSKSE